MRFLVNFFFDVMLRAADMSCKHIWGANFYELTVTACLVPVNDAIQIMSTEALEGAR